MLDSSVLQSLAILALGTAVTVAGAASGLSAFRDIRRSRKNELTLRMPDQLVLGVDAPISLKSLTDLLSSLTQRHNLEQVCEVVTHRTLELLSAGYTALYVRNGSHYELRAHAGIDPSQFPTRRIGRDNKLVRYLEEGDKPAAHLGQHHPQLQGLKKYLPPTREVIAVTLAASTGPFGFLAVANKTEGRSFKPQDVEVLAYVAVPMALHLHNSMLNQQLEGAYTTTIIAMANALEARDEFSRGHSERVAHVATDFARMLNLPPRTVQVIREGALLHDLGKIGIPDAILQKKGRLDAGEYETMKQHSEIGYNILKDLQFMQEQAFLVRHHHEHYDGSGYPQGLSQEQIPEPVMILTLADVWDALTHERPHRHAMPYDQAVAEMQTMSGTLFEPRYLKKFLEYLQLTRPMQSDAGVQSRVAAG